LKLTGGRGHETAYFFIDIVHVYGAGANIVQALFSVIPGVVECTAATVDNDFKD
jgi:hypothetical protein